MCSFKQSTSAAGPHARGRQPSGGRAQAPVLHKLTLPFSHFDQFACTSIVCSWTACWWAATLWRESSGDCTAPEKSAATPLVPPLRQQPVRSRAKVRHSECGSSVCDLRCLYCTREKRSQSSGTFPQYPVRSKRKGANSMVRHCMTLAEIGWWGWILMSLITQSHTSSVDLLMCIHREASGACCSSRPCDLTSQQLCPRRAGWPAPHAPQPQRRRQQRQLRKHNHLNCRCNRRNRNVCTAPQPRCATF